MVEVDDDGAMFQFSTSPPLTGTLVLSLTGGIKQAVCRLLGLPNGIHLRKLNCTLHSKQDLRWITSLVKECSDTLEHVDISAGTYSKLLSFTFPYGTST